MQKMARQWIIRLLTTQWLVRLWLRRNCPAWPPPPRVFVNLGRPVLLALVAFMTGLFLKIKRRRIEETDWLVRERNNRRSKLMATLQRSDDSAEDVIDMVEKLGKCSHNDALLNEGVKKGCTLIAKEITELLHTVRQARASMEENGRWNCKSTEDDSFEGLQRFVEDVPGFEETMQRYCSSSLFAQARQHYLAGYNEALSLLRNQHIRRMRKVFTLLQRVRRQLLFVGMSSFLSLIYGTLSASRYHYHAQVINLAKDLATSPQRPVFGPTLHAMMLSEFLCLVVDILRTQVSSLGKREAVRKLKVDLFTQLITQDIEWLEKQDIYRIRALVGSCGATLTSLLDYPTLAVENVARLTSSVAMLAKWNAPLACSLMVVLPAKILLVEGLRQVQNRLEDYFFVPDLRGAFKSVWQALVEPRSFRVLRSFGRENCEIARFDLYAAMTEQLEERGHVLYRVFDPLQALLDNSVEIFTLWYGGRLALAGKMNFGDLSSFLLVANNAFDNVMTLHRSHTMLSRGVLDKVESIVNLLTLTPRIGIGGARALPVEGWTVEFRNVSFRYPSRPQVLVLDDVSFTVPRGESLGIVGHTGAGKSTVAALLLRLYDPDSGSILIDGLDLREYNVTELRKGMGVVSQDLIMLEETIRDNVTYAAPDSSDKDVKEVLIRCEAGIFYDKAIFPQQLDTKVSQLSGGQKQRLGLARALLKKPRCCILDEATSALDEISMKKVIEAVELQRQAGMTTLVIAHRLSNFRFVTNLVILDRGRVVEAGTKQELALKDDGVYKTLLEASRVDDAPHRSDA